MRSCTRPNRMLKHSGQLSFSTSNVSTSCVKAVFLPTTSPPLGETRERKRALKITFFQQPAKPIGRRLIPRPVSIIAQPRLAPDNPAPPLCSALPRRAASVLRRRWRRGGGGGGGGGGPRRGAPRRGGRPPGGGGGGRRG